MPLSSWPAWISARLISGRHEDAFDLVIPSLPGYGFSGEPTELRWGPGRVVGARAELMHRLGE
jgi:hypothetical protein